jgi:LuxR family transcriptional regulator, glucitol operon activator
MVYSAPRLTLYAVLSSLEQDLRALLSNNETPGEIDVAALPEDVLAKAKDRILDGQGSISNNPSLADVLPFIDFPELTALLGRCRTYLPTPLAEHLKPNLKRLEGLTPIRNRVAHSRPLQLEDLPTVLHAAETLSRGHETVWPQLSATLRRIKDDPSFVLGLDIPRVPADDSNHNLPTPDFDETGFVGRESYVQDVTRACLGPWPVISVIGEGGVGKTALALKTAYDILDREDAPFEALVWSTSKSTQITAEGIRAIEGAIRSSLGLLTNVAEYLAGPGIEDPFAEVLSYLKEFRILLVLDNLETVLDDRIRSFLEQLPSGSKATPHDNVVVHGGWESRSEAIV